MKEPGDYSKEITLDAANGVGALKVQKLLEQTPGIPPPSGSMHGFKFTRFYCSFLMQVKEPGDYSKEITLDAANGVGALKVQKLLEQSPGLPPPSGSMHGFKFTRFYCSFLMQVKEPGDYSKEITLDAANGVGALKVQKLLEQSPGLPPPSGSMHGFKFTRFYCSFLMQVKEPGDYSKEITLDAANGVGALKVQKLLEQSPGLPPPSGSMHGFKFTRFYCSFLMQVKEPGDYSKEITLDAANGVGALKVQKLLEQTPGIPPPSGSMHGFKFTRINCSFLM